MTWKDYQPIEYPDGKELNEAVQELQELDPIITESEIEHFQDLLIKIQDKPQDYFILQIGHCAEMMGTPNNFLLFEKFFNLFQKAQETLLWSRRKEEEGAGEERKRSRALIPMLRMAGQFAKPRSNLYESLCSCQLKSGGKSCISKENEDPNSDFNAKVNGVNGTVQIECTTIQVPAYRGDMINSHGFHGRTPDPSRLLLAYRESKRSIGYLQELSIEQRPIYTMHEYLCLPYEIGLARSSQSSSKADFAGSAHMVWLGDRTAFPDSLHLYYLSKVSNPISIKLGPGKSIQDTLRMLDCLNPGKLPGKIMIITRFGIHKVKEGLPRFIQEVERSGHRVLWLCDPMHGNTYILGDSHGGRKIRNFNDILSEIIVTFGIHAQLGTQCSGLHLEVSEDPHTTECLGGLADPIETIQDAFYTTACDPRLNPNQLQDLIQYMAASYLL